MFRHFKHDGLMVYSVKAQATIRQKIASAGFGRLVKSLRASMLAICLRTLRNPETGKPLPGDKMHAVPKPPSQRSKEIHVGLCQRINQFACNY